MAQKVLVSGWNNQHFSIQTKEENVFEPILVSHSCFSNLKQIACGGSHNIVLSNDGEVFVFGRNKKGQLGLGHENDVLQPTELSLSLFHDQKISYVAAGDQFSIFVTETGLVFSCGNNFNGQLGLAHTNNVNTPTLISLLQRKFIIEAHCGSKHVIFLTQKGTLYAAGYGFFGSLGQPTNEDSCLPKRIEVGWKVKSISVKENFNVVLTTDFEVYTFGGINSSQMNMDANFDFSPKKLVKHINGRRVIEAVAAPNHGILRTKDGIFVFGNSLDNCGYLQYIPNLINATDDSHLCQTEIELKQKKFDLSSKFIVETESKQFRYLYRSHFFKDCQISQLHCTQTGNYVLDEKGDLYAFGVGEYGEFGTTEKQKIMFPEKILTNVTSLFVGYWHVFFVIKQ